MNNRVKFYLSLKEYRERFLENDSYKENEYEYGGCGCAL